VTEEHPLVPLSLYNKYKGMCEPLLFKHQSPDFTCVTIRPATVCGYSPRMRLDLSVNILTNLAVNKGTITVFGGKQLRPNLHINDMADVYELMIEAPAEKIAGQIFNAGYQNLSIARIAEIVRDVVGGVDIVRVEGDQRETVWRYRHADERPETDLVKHWGFRPTQKFARPGYAA
jgi:nucleoside-diphosphate-sugar epimerase